MMVVSLYIHFFIFIAVSVRCIFYFYYLAQTGTCYRYCDTCCKVIATCSCEVGWIDEIVCTIRVRWYTGSISVEVTANYNPGHVWPCSSVILILPWMKPLCAYKSQVLDTIWDRGCISSSSNYLIQHIHYKMLTATAVAQWLQWSAADPKDAGSIQVAVGAFRWRRNSRKTCVLYNVSARSRTPGGENYAEPSATASLIAWVILGRWNTTNLKPEPEQEIAGCVQLKTLVHFRRPHSISPKKIFCCPRPLDHCTSLCGVTKKFFKNAFAKKLASLHWAGAAFRICAKLWLMESYKNVL